jgi:hypothetical protein
LVYPTRLSASLTTRLPFLSVLVSGQSFLVIYTWFGTMSRRGKNKAAAASTESKGRPGPKGNFQGFRLEYMESIFPTYLQRVREGTTKSYWAVLVAEAGYWARFNWRHSDIKEEFDEDTFRNASVLPDIDGELSAKEEQEKAQVMMKTNKVHSIVTG